MQEFFLSSHGSRKALSDTAMKTADSGYLTRRLVDISQEVIVREEDCFLQRGLPIRGVHVTELLSGKQSIESLEERLRGRTADITDPATGEVLVHQNELIDHAKAKTICDAGIKSVFVRSVLTCCTRNGVCARCYGQNMAHGGKVDVGEAVGVIAAQAIGDDRLQQQSQGRVVPDSFTHGTSQQRYSWFKRGFDSGDPAQCNTFGKSI